MVTGAILAPPETQRLVVSGTTGTYSSATPGKDSYVPIDPGGEMATPVFFQFRCFGPLLFTMTNDYLQMSCARILCLPCPCE